MSTNGHTVVNYIEDIIGYDLNSKVDQSFQDLYSLLQDLGLNISEHKLVYPITKAICLGVEIEVPSEKLKEIRVACYDWLTKTHCSKRELKSLLGKLLYIINCVRASRFFLNRMLTTLRLAHKLDTIYLDIEFRKDVQMSIHYDNQTVVTILNTGYTRDLTLAAIARNIFMLTAQLNLNITTFHIPGNCNSRYPL